jgi:hypothetical protein
VLGTDLAALVSLNKELGLYTKSEGNLPVDSSRREA